MLLQAAAVALALFAASVSAQTNASFIDPNSVTPQLKASWCNGQQNVCTVLCDKNVNDNTCNPNNLTWSCLCASNNSSPDIADYTTSLPAFICQKSFALCIANNQNDQQGEDNCTTTIEAKCGTLEIANYKAPASTSTAGPSATAGKSASSSGTATATAATTSATKSSAAIAIGRDYGTGLIAAAVVAAFGLLG